MHFCKLHNISPPSFLPLLLLQKIMIYLLLINTKERMIFMAIDGIYLYSLVEDLKKSILNSKIDKINQPEKMKL